MAWSPLQRDIQKLAECVASEYDFVVDDVIRTRSASSGGRERIVALRQLVEAVVNGTESLDLLLDTLAQLEDDQRATAEDFAADADKFGQPELFAAFQEAFLQVADALADMTQYAEAEQLQSLLGGMAVVEERVAEVDQKIQALPEADAAPEEAAEETADDDEAGSLA